ncbi:GyrI-like domain-containing protein [Sorangium sp. So ce1128]
MKIARFEETCVAALEHRGDPKRILESVRRFIGWRRENRLPPRSSATFNVLHDDPAETPPEGSARYVRISRVHAYLWEGSEGEVCASVAHELQEAQGEAGRTSIRGAAKEA